MTAALVVPRDVLDPRKPDEHFAPEADEARRRGLSVILVDHDALAAGDAANAFGRQVEPCDHAWYRGWMLAPHRYGGFVAVASERGIRLCTDEPALRRAHHLPGWYPHLRGLTAESAWTDGDDLDQFEAALLELGGGAAVLKDYSKSEKHYWDEAMFIPDVSDVAHARRVAARFREFRGDYFDGGYAVRRFETYEPGEARSWWVDGRCVVVSAHPDDPERTPPDLDLGFLEDGVRALGNPFVTIDLATRSDGELRVVEVGDGQVSDRPRSLDPALLIEALGLT